MQIKIITLTNYHDECDNATQINIEFLVGNRKNSPLKKKESFRNGKYLVRNMTHEKIK